MILYFTGTGNSRYLAQKLAYRLGDTLVSINLLLKERKQEELVSEQYPFVFVCPTYAYRLPRVVEEFLCNTNFKGNKKAYFIMTCGDDAGASQEYIEPLCKKNDLTYQGVAEVVMPENYLVMYPVTDKKTAHELLVKSDMFLDKIVQEIKAQEKFAEIKSITLMDRLKSGIMNAAFYKFVVRAKGFYFTNNCISCEQCSRLCPLNNISMIEGKPYWGDSCTHCMACICGCPKTAIEYKNKTQGKERYYLQEKYK